MNKPCILCGSCENDEVTFGEFDKQEKNTVHRNCLILCVGQFLQRADPGYRMWNFFKKDLAAEKKRISLFACSYCYRMGANLSCCHRGCKRNFHTKCGIVNMGLLQYDGKFNTFCGQHVPKTSTRPEPGENCVLCLAPVVPDGQDFRSPLAFQAPCCHNGWFHRECVQDHSIATNYCFKCPLCRNEDRFEGVALFGVAIPKWRFALPNPPDAAVPRESVIAGQQHRRGSGPRIIHTPPVRYRGRAPRVRVRSQN
ncbi:PHD finger protein 7-like [Drosophila serrata]|uniref:PHD finger protein 7-like n=1 Tax=Drosophila serrata TaxID=7274 RepID=UPI000A1D3083|nr:PHD finger protein 7-like [Drosophila serrata]